MEKLNTTILVRVYVDDNFYVIPYEWIQKTLLGKFFGEALPLHKVMVPLTNDWKGFGCFTVANMDNGSYLYICQSSNIKENLFEEGRCSSFLWEKISTQLLSNLTPRQCWSKSTTLPKLWHVEMLKTLTPGFGHLFKINEHILNSTLAKFAHLCVKIDLLKPL